MQLRDVSALLIGLLAITPVLAGSTAPPKLPPHSHNANHVDPADSDALDYDVLVVGSSSGGVGAAIGAARHDADVLLVSAVARLGGMMTNGVTTDVGDPSRISGLFGEWQQQVAWIYESDGVDSRRWQSGLFATPSAALEAVERILFAEPIDIATGWWVDHLGSPSVDVTAGQVESVTITDGSSTVTVRADVVIDATVEGDVLAAAGRDGVDYTWGREGRDVYGEDLAPAASDRLSQASTYRVTAQVGADPVDAPDRYAEWRPVYEKVPMEQTRFRCLVWDGFRPRILTGGRLQRCLPGQMLDINIDLVGIDHDYLIADRSGRAEIEAVHKSFVLGWLHHLHHVHGWPVGLADDEYDGGWPEVLYLREGRRLLGETILTEQDFAKPGESPRSWSTSVAIGDYGLDSHCVTGTVSGADDCQGGFWQPILPYEVPYEVMVPQRFENLLVPVAVSASHVGYQTLRMEPVRMNLGYAAGIAATLSDGDVSTVPVDELRRLLVRSGQDVDLR